MNAPAIAMENLAPNLKPSDVTFMPASKKKPGMDSFNIMAEKEAYVVTLKIN